MQREPNLGAQISAQQFDDQGVESLDVAFKVLEREVGVALDDVDDDGTPGYDVAVLRFVVELGVGADDFYAEPGWMLVRGGEL